MVRRFTLATLVLALAGCAPGNSGLLVGNVVAPDDQGTYTASSPAITEGIYDLSFNLPYRAVLRMLNQTINIGNTGTTGAPVANPNLITVRELEVQLQDVGGAPLAVGAAEYRVPVGSVTIPTSDGMSAGEALASAELIPLSIADSLAGMGDATVVVVIRAVGQTAGGAEVVSPEYTYPLRVCTGCLQVCAFDDDGDQICNPAPTPGQDFVNYSCAGMPDPMGGVFPACVSGS